MEKSLICRDDIVVVTFYIAVVAVYIFHHVVTYLIDVYYFVAGKNLSLVWFCSGIEIRLNEVLQVVAWLALWKDSCIWADIVLKLTKHKLLKIKKEKSKICKQCTWPYIKSMSCNQILNKHLSQSFVFSNYIRGSDLPYLARSLLTTSQYYHL